MTLKEFLLNEYDGGRLNGLEAIKIAALDYQIGSIIFNPCANDRKFYEELSDNQYLNKLGPSVVVEHGTQNKELIIYTKFIIDSVEDAPQGPTSLLN